MAYRKKESSFHWLLETPEFGSRASSVSHERMTRAIDHATTSNTNRNVRYGRMLILSDRGGKRRVSHHTESERAMEIVLTSSSQSTC